MISMKLDTLESFLNNHIDNELTFLYMGEFGNITYKHVKVHEVERTDFAQYKNIVRIVYKNRGKRKLFKLNYYGHKLNTLAIYKGFTDLNVDCSELENGYKVVTMFSQKNFQKVIDQNSIKPLLAFCKEYV